MPHTLFVLSLWIHVLAATAWIGGSLFLSLAVVPTLSDSRFASLSGPLVRAIARRFQPMVWTAFGLLVVTGIFNLLVYGGMRLDFLLRGAFWTSSYGTALAVKLTLFGLVLTLSVAHDFIGPRLTAASRADPNSLRARRLRRWLRWGGRLNLVLGILIIGLGIALAQRWPR